MASSSIDAASKDNNNVDEEAMEPIPLSDSPEVESKDHSDHVPAKKTNILVIMLERVTIMKRVFKEWWRKHFSSDDHVKITRVYHHWPGNNVFFFKGRLICGPDPKGLLLTSLAVILSSWVFVAYVAQDLPHHSCPIVIIYAILTLIVLANLMMVSAIDPGIIPRYDRSSNLEEHSSGKFRAKKKKIIVNGVEMKLKYCRTCKIYRPPRCCHCAICDNCVEKFDHHCPWIGQCIGVRNYRFYFLLLVTGFIYFAYIFGFCFWTIHQRVFKGSSRWLGLLKNSPETAALTSFSFVAVSFLGCLASYHVYLTATNQTFYENFRQRYSESTNPYNKGFWNNVKEVLFEPLPPSKVNFRAEVTQEKLRQSAGGV